MKAKYLMMALVGMLTLGATTSCEDFSDQTYLSEVKVSQSYVSFKAAGDTTTIEVKASSAWEFNSVPEWLTVSPAQGGAGVTKVTLTALAASETRQGTFYLMCDGAKQNINYIQQTAKVETPMSTVAEVLAGPDSKTYRVKGICAKIANTEYGNWYLGDEATGEFVYIYGTLDVKGATKNFLSLGIEIGDEITVEGPKTTYNGTVELVDVTVLNISKSLIKCDSTDVEALPIEGGFMTAYVTCKANGISVEIPEEAQSWLSVVGVNNSTVKFRAVANDGGDRSTVVTLKTNDGKKDYSSQVTVFQKGAILACSVADFLAAAEGDALFRLTAAVTSVDGKNVYVRDFSGDVLVYNPTLGDFTIKAGDIITVVGKRASYKGAAQMGSPVIEAVTPVTAIDLASFKALADDKTTLYLISGKVSQPTEPNTKFDLETYGNFSLVDEAGTELYVYGVSTGVGGESKKFNTLGVKEGDILNIIAYKTSYTKNDYVLMQAGGAMYFGHTPANNE